MKLYKKILAATSAFVVCITNFCLGSRQLFMDNIDIAVSATEVYGRKIRYDDYLFYTKIDSDEDGTYDYVEISDCVQSASEVNIPKEIDGLTVKRIGEEAFYRCSSLTNITIPDSVTSIGVWAFGCTGLTGITIPDSVTSIGVRAFSSCKGLTSITIPDSVTLIGRGAFSECTGLISITIPDSVTVIGADAFSECSRLKTINVSENNNNYSSIDGVLFNKEKTKLIQYSKGNAISEYIVPDSVTSIETGAFYRCSSLTSIAIPDSVTSIGDSAFKSCTGLTSITIPDGVTSIGEEAFYGCSRLTGITIPDSVTSIGKSVFSFCESLTSITIPDSVTSIGKSSFSSCEGLTSITIPDSVTSIGENAFSSCKSLTSITIPDSVTSIENMAFYACLRLTSITIKNPECEIYSGSGNATICNGVYDLGYFYYNVVICGYKNSTAQAYADRWGYTFNEINGEPPVTTIPATTEPITTTTAQTTEKPVDDHLSYKKIDFDEDGTYDYIEISDCDQSVSEIIIPKEIDGLPVKRIGKDAFWGCTSLTGITIPDSVTSIGMYAFENCSSLTGITISNSVISIGKGAFYSCSGLTGIAIPDSVTSIGEWAFGGCKALTSITIPDSVTSIGKSAFSGCKDLTSITIKNTKCEIGDYDSTISNDINFGNYYYDGVICGYKNSTAQSYAEKYGYTFKEIEPPTLQGDISGNGEIDLQDAVEIAKYILGTRKFTNEEFNIADYDSNGEVDLQDAVGIAKYILKHLND